MKSTQFWRSMALTFAIGAAHMPQAQAGPLSPFELLKKLDNNRDNRLSEQEFVGEKGGASRTKARKQFRRLDADGDRWLTLKELKKL
jgi:hypothetical protein